MGAGELRNYVSIQKPTVTQNSYGEQVVSWTTDSKCWADISPLSGREYFSAQQVQSGVTHRVRIWYQTLSASTAIGPKCRIRFGSRYFNIGSVINLKERNIYLDLMCVESS